MECGGISVNGRIASGVKLIDLKQGVTVASIAKVREKKESLPEEQAQQKDANEIREV